MLAYRETSRTFTKYRDLRRVAPKPLHIIASPFERKALVTEAIIGISPRIVGEFVQGKPAEYIQPIIGTDNDDVVAHGEVLARVQTELTVATECPCPAVDPEKRWAWLRRCALGWRVYTQIQAVLLSEMHTAEEVELRALWSWLCRRSYATPRLVGLWGAPPQLAGRWSTKRNATPHSASII